VVATGAGSAKRELGHLDRRRPHAQPHDPIVLSDGEGALIGEVLVEGDYQSVRSLCPPLALLLCGWLGSSGAKSDDLLLVNDGTGVVQRRDDVVARQLRVGM
jgi:hypothetical protein